MSKAKRSPITRSGTRRLGDEYQDLVALELLVDWLEHSDRYEWIEVEADKVGALDDIVALRSDGVMLYRQVKFAVHSNDLQDLWTWERLLEKGKGKKQPLLQAWASSLQKIMKSDVSIDAALYSNRDAAPEIAQAFQRNDNGNLYVDLTRLLPTTREKLIEQLGSEEQAQTFFQHFHFDLNKPNLPELEEGLKRRFATLGGSHEGWLSLKEAVGIWVCNREFPLPDGRIRFIDVQQATLWHTAEGLTQDFSVPDDYVPLESFIEDFKQRIWPNHSGCIVVTGSPGIGKSTFISYLYNTFLEMNVPAIRHHYYIGSQDPAPGFRLDYFHTAESFMHDLLRDHSQALGNLRGENPHSEHLRKWITVCGEYYAQHNQTFYILLDGLDHVWRETGTVAELTQLLNHLFPLPSGIAIIFATQPVDERYLPQVFLRHTPSQDQWIQVPRLDLPAVTDWVGKHVKDFFAQEGLSHSPILIERLAQALYKKGQGHPLHLRYTLKAIQERNLAFTEETITTLPGCPHEGIIAYYQELWHSLPEGSQAIMYLFAATQFPWQRYDLEACLDPQGQQTTKVYEDLRQIMHLLLSGDLGLQPCHSSILAFIVQREEYSDYKTLLLQKTLSWLQQKAPAYWKWAYLWFIEAQLGNDTALYREPTRTWVLNVLVAGRPHRHTLGLLHQSMECALKHGDISRLVEVGLLHSYFYEIYPSHLYICERIRYSQLKLMEDPHLHASLLNNLDDVTDDELVLLAEDACTRDDQKTFTRCRRVVQRRVRYRQQYLSGGSYPSWQQYLTPQLAFAAMRNEGHIIHSVAEFIATNRNQGRSQEIAYLYGERLYRYRNSEHLRTLLSFPMGIDEKEQKASSQQKVLVREEASLLQRYAILLALEEDLDVDDVLLSGTETDPLVGLYAAIRSTPGYHPTVFDLPSHQLLNLKWHKAYEHKFELRELFYQAFFVFLANHLYNQGNVNDVWLQAPGTLRWVQHVLQELNAYAVIIASNIRASAPIIFGDLFTKLNTVPLPKLDVDRAIYEYYKAVCEAAVNIELDLTILSNAISGKSFINQIALQQALSSEYCDLDVLLQKIAIRQQRIFEGPAVQWLMDEQMTLAQTSIVPCTERAERFARLGECAVLHEEWNVTRQCIKVSADHMLAHGYHKDMLFYNTLGAIQCYAKNIPHEILSPSLVASWIMRLAPAVATITDYTDGDETCNFPVEIADALGLVAPEKLYDYYEWQCAQGNHHQALSTLHVFLEKADLTQPVAQALAVTAIDRQSLHILAQRVADGDAGAQRVLTQQHAYFGSMVVASVTTASPQPELDTITTNVFNPEEYSPDTFMDYLKASDGYAFKQTIETWVEFWVKKKKKAEVCQVLIDTDARGIDIECYDQLFNLVRSLYGKGKAYPWLVKAHIMDCGWNWYISKQERVERRWQMLKAQYPERWHEFLKDTLLQTPVWRSTSFSHYDFRRLIEYHIFMEQYEQAQNLLEEMVRRSCELVSMLPLSRPEWVDIS